MKKEQCKRKENKNKMLSVRITSEARKWIIDNKLSATAIFNQALKELGYKEE